jgi:hypothetical protein
MYRYKVSLYSVFGTDDYEDRQLMYEEMSWGRYKESHTTKERLMDDEGAGYNVAEKIKKKVRAVV